MGEGERERRGTLYVVASPIGNLEDLSPRAARVLREADIIAAEDTRSALRLLGAADAGGAANPARRIVSSFEGNEAARAEELAGALAGGARVAVISEAGTPGVSDPGERAVAAAIGAGARVEVVPGPSAALAALVGSGLAMDRFVFLGFPPRVRGARHELFGTLRGEPGTMIFYEAPDRVGATLADLAGALGAELVLLHVTSEAPLWGETLYTPKVRAVFDSQRRWAADALAERVAALAGAGVTARAVVTTGVAWSEIVKAATDEKADVIVMGTHGRTGLDRIFLGSVAERVLRHATCPVLTVRPGSVHDKKRGAA